MDVSELLLEMYGRIPPLARDVVDGLDAAQLVERPTSAANSIAWLIWHLARVQDHHMAELLHADQLWVDGPWAGELGLAPDPGNTGYGHSASDVATIRPRDGQVLLDYLAAV